MTDIFETEPFKTYDEKFMALTRAITTHADAAVIEKLEAEAALLKTALVEAETKRRGHAVRSDT